MILDLLDTIKTSEKHYPKDMCELNAVQGESMLFYNLLSGYTPILTQTQAMDSKIILNILLDSRNREHFLKLLQSGKIKLSLYNRNGAQSLQDYFKESLSYGIDNEDELFNFSTMPFLDEYDLKTRKKLNKKIIEALEHNRYDFSTDDVKGEHVDFISEIVKNIQDMDRAIKGKYLISTGFKNNIDNIFKSQCQEFKNRENENPDSEFAKLRNYMLSLNNYNNRRSVYYNVISSMGNYYSSDNIKRIRQLVDNCYHYALSSSIEDNDGCSINLSDKLKDLSEPVSKLGKVNNKKNVKIISNDKDDFLTWEVLYNILNEVERIEKKKNISRIEALNEYKKSQHRNPIIAVSKYFVLTVGSALMPSLPIVEIISDIFMNTTTDFIGEKLKKPSTGEILKSVKDAKNKNKIAQKAIEFISMTIE